VSFAPPKEKVKRNNMYCVYILRSLKDGKYYIGSTSNIESRLINHNSGRQRSTKNRIPFVLVYSENYPKKSMAEKRERQTKSYKGGKVFKRLINGVPGLGPGGRPASGGTTPTTIKRNYHY